VKTSVRGHLQQLFTRMHAVIRAIPRGSVATYGQVAELAGLPGGARVAAASLKRGNLRGANLPWQRVIGKSGPARGRIKILDPVGAAIQRELLEAEGVPVGDTGHIDLRVFGWLPGAEPITARTPRKAATRRRRSRSKPTGSAAARRTPADRR
jgi:methylated-DNA-protein-cysteine methyltransferase-like protein